MSNKQLPGATHHKYSGPYYPEALDILQKLYSVRGKPRPITRDEIEHFAQDIRPFLGAEIVKFEDDFITQDGTVWFAVRFQPGNGPRYKLAFPSTEDAKHKDGTSSAHHVAIYYFSDDELPDSKVAETADMIAKFFKSGRM